MPNYSAAVNTRSLSIASIGVAGGNRTNSALLYYENPTGNISALLRRLPVSPGTLQYTDFEYVDITHQSKTLPDEFRNNGTLDSHESRTLYELDVPFSTPFASQTNWSANIGALFYSPSGSSANNGSLFFFQPVDYVPNSSGPGTFSVGMYCAFSHPKHVL